MENKTKKSPKWEVKDRLYELIEGRPIVRIIKRKNLYWFDQEKGYQREMAYSVNQNTPFVDEFKGRIRPCLLYTSPSPRDGLLSRMPSSA